MRHAVAILLVALATLDADGQKVQGLAVTPPMGWNSWNHFGCSVDEALVRAVADAMNASGMRATGYSYLIIDDCWQGERDADGVLRPDPERFPSGMKALADALHRQGFKLGIYSCAGATTCAGRPGSRGHEYQDALAFARWGIDYLKYDWCDTDGLSSRAAYTTMRDALRASGRSIVLSICEWGDTQPWTWGKDIGHLWRTTGDIHPCWDCEVSHGSWSSWGILPILDRQLSYRAFAGPDHWNDPDMLEVGNGMTESEDRAHFSLWAMLAAPLVAGNDLRNMSDATRRILTNAEVIAVDQDPLGIQGFRYLREGDLEIWFKPLAGDAWAMCVLNRGKKPLDIRIDWTRHEVEDDLVGRHVETERTTYNIRDLWLHTDCGNTRSVLTGTVRGHDVMLLRLDPGGPVEPDPLASAPLAPARSAYQNGAVRDGRSEESDGVSGASACLTPQTGSRLPFGDAVRIPAPPAGRPHEPRLRPDLTPL